jgi:hypothetical protein
MVQDLVHLQEDGAGATLLRLMVDPRRQNDSLLTLCADANIAPVTLLSLLKDASFARAMIQTRLKVAERLPTVLDRVADAAEGQLVACGCTLGGTVAALETCVKCRGNGKVWERPSLPHQRMMMEVAQLVQAPGATNVNVQTQVGVQLGSSKNFFDQVVKGFGQSMQALDVKRPTRPADLDVEPTVIPTDRPILPETDTDADQGESS